MLKTLGYERDWECGCGHKFTATIVLSDTTARLSGERTEWCPRCGKAPLYGSVPRPGLRRPEIVQPPKGDKS